MIGSPWNPFFDQAIPGTTTRYDGRRVDSLDDRQHGAYNLIRLPQYLELEGGDDFGNPIVLSRDYSLLSAGSKLLASQFALTFGDQWGKPPAANILRTAYTWFYAPQQTFNGGLPRVMYRSGEVIERNSLTDDPEPTGRYWWFAAGVPHQDGRLGSTLGLGPREQGRYWPHWWSLWQADDTPISLGGDPTLWTRQGTAYPLYARECYIDNDIPQGSRIVSPFDPNRRFRMDDILPPQSPPGGGTPVPSPPVFLRPWYRGANNGN